MVDLAEDYVGRNNKKGQRRAVRLDDKHELMPTNDNGARASGTFFFFLKKIYPLLMIIYG